MTELQALFIENMKRYRKRVDLTQSGLAERSGLSSNYVSNIEAGRKFPSIATIERIADALGIKAFRLFADDRDAETPGFGEAIIRYSESLKEKVDLVIEESRKTFISNPDKTPDT